MEDRRGIGLIEGGQFVEHFRSLEAAQAAVADAQLDTGQIAVAIRGDEAAPAVVTGAGEGQSVPVGGLPVLLPLEKPEADVAADLGPRPVIGKGAKQRCQCCLVMAQLLMTVGAVAAGVDVVLHPSPALLQKPLKDSQRLLPAVVVVELPAVVELLAGLQFLSRVQLRLVDAQVPARFLMSRSR